MRSALGSTRTPVTKICVRSADLHSQMSPPVGPPSAGCGKAAVGRWLGADPIPGIYLRRIHAAMAAGFAWTSQSSLCGEPVSTHRRAGIVRRGDLAYLPLASDTFEGVVSLHTLHHLPKSEHEQGVAELSRVLAPGGGAAVVYSWGDGGWLMRLTGPLVRGMSQVVVAITDGDGWRRRISRARNNRSAGHPQDPHAQAWLPITGQAPPGYLPGLRSPSLAIRQHGFHIRAFIHEHMGQADAEPVVQVQRRLHRT